MDKATTIIDIVWRAYLGGRRASICAKLHWVVLIKFYAVTRERTGGKGPGLCGSQQSWCPGGKSLRAGARWSGRVDTPCTGSAWAFVSDHLKSAMLTGGEARLWLDGEFGWGSLTLLHPSFIQMMDKSPTKTCSNSVDLYMRTAWKPGRFACKWLYDPGKANEEGYNL